MICLYRERENERRKEWHRDTLRENCLKCLVLIAVLINFKYIYSQWIVYVSEGKCMPSPSCLNWLTVRYFYIPMKFVDWHLSFGNYVTSVMVTSAALLFTENYLPWMSIFSHKTISEVICFASDIVHYASAIFLWCCALQNTCSCILICNAAYDTYTFSSSVSAHTWSHAHISWNFFL